MFIKSLKYSQYVNTPQEWTLDKFDLHKINLIVGKNASGKTKTLNILANLANLIAGERKDIDHGSFEAIFSNNSKDLSYTLKIEENKVVKEKLVYGKDVLLDRKAGGKGKIFFKELACSAAFQTPENEVAVFARRDSIQHPFLEDLFNWAKSTRHYQFGTSLGKQSVVVKAPTENAINLKDSNSVGLFLKNGIEKHGTKFKNQIKKDMNKLGYQIDDLGVEKLPNVSILNAPFQDIEGIFINESDIEAKTFQMEISQGMFRALSLIIQINYSYLESKPTCIIIDDIGEGLDYDRSNNLIKLLIAKINNPKNSVQLVMATNDRFIMNNVPLENWIVINREKKRSKLYTYKNSKKVFDEFKFTGLNNFDFFSSNFYSEGFEKQ